MFLFLFCNLYTFLRKTILLIYLYFLIDSEFLECKKLNKVKTRYVVYVEFCVYGCFKNVYIYIFWIIGNLAKNMKYLIFQFKYKYFNIKNKMKHVYLKPFIFLEINIFL